MLHAVSARRLCLSISNGQVKKGAIIYLPFTEHLLDMRPNARKQTSPISGPVQGCKWVFLTPFGWVRNSQHGEVERLLKVTRLAVAEQGRESVLGRFPSLTAASHHETQCRHEERTLCPLAAAVHKHV